MKSIQFFSIVTLLVNLPSLAQEPLNRSASLKGHYAANQIRALETHNETGSWFTQSEFHDYYGYYWNLFSFDPKRDERHKNLISSTGSFRFLGLSSDGSAIQTEFSFVNDGFQKLLSSGTKTLRIRATWRLDNCDNIPVSNAVVDANSDISDVVSSFLAYDFSRYMKCELKLAAPPSCSETGNGITCGERNNSITLAFLDSGDIVLSGPRDDRPSAYFRSTQAADPEAERAVLDAAESLAALLKEYGNLLLMLRDSTVVDRTAALTAFLAKSKPELIAALGVINQNIDKTSALAKLSVTSIVNRGYGYVRFMEGKLQGTFLLDEVIVKP